MCDANVLGICGAHITPDCSQSCPWKSCLAQPQTFTTGPTDVSDGTILLALAAPNEFPTLNSLQFMNSITGTYGSWQICRVRSSQLAGSTWEPVGPTLSVAHEPTLVGQLGPVIARGFFGEGATAEIPVNIQLAGWVVLVAKALSVADPVIQTIVRFT